MSLSNEDLMAQAQRIVAKAWADDAFKAVLIADPKATLAAEGIALPEGLTLKVLEDTADTLHVILPPPPAAALSDEAVGAVAGGVFCPCFTINIQPPVATLYSAFLENGVPTPGAPSGPPLPSGICQQP